MVKKKVVKKALPPISKKPTSWRGTKKREEKQFGLVSSDWSIDETILNQKKAYIISGGKEGFCLEKKVGLVEIEITIREK